MEFNPSNNVIKLCIRGIAMEEAGQTDDARTLFLQAWNESTNDFEKYLASYYVARSQENVADKLKWFERTLQLAMNVNNESATSALPNLYANIARCYEELGEPDNAKTNFHLAASFPVNPTDKGPFFHGTKADLQVGDLLTPGGNSNYKADLVMNHIYFTAIANGAGLAADLAKGDAPGRVYIVEPMGDFENDPNVTDKKFPGNPTRSYRSHAPLKIVGEFKDWVGLTAEQLKSWQEKLANGKGEIIN